MSPLAPEDLLQLIFDQETLALKTSSGTGRPVASEGTLLDVLGALRAGPREQVELPKVLPDYDADYCKAEFSAPRPKVLMVAMQDVYWVDSAADDQDAKEKLTDPGRRGFLPARVPLRIASAAGIPRVDFLSLIPPSAAVFVTGM